MKSKIIFIILFASFSLCLSQTYYLNIDLRDGTKAQYVIYDIQKIDFNGITNIGDAKKIEHIINAFKLLQNYPNPFNPSTTIEYQIPKAGIVKVMVYDLRGRLINTLVNKFQQDGIHKVKWDGVNKSGRKVASGFYIYSIKFGNKRSSQKMILIK